MHRLFVAIDIPERVKGQVVRLGADLAGARWVPEGQLHLTLRFIGDVEESLFADLRMGLAAIRAPQFPMHLQGVGFFPPRKDPRVLWVGVEGNDALTALHHQVTKTLALSGIAPEERKFAPHITLARLKGAPVTEVNRFVAAHSAFASEPFPVSEFVLYSSFLTPKGAIHRKEEVYALESCGAG